MRRAEGESSRHFVLQTSLGIGHIAIVHDEVCHRDEGRSLIFDDAYQHEAWNYTAAHS